jgi:cell shape-determining protein MreC
MAVVRFNQVFVLLLLLSALSAFLIPARYTDRFRNVQKLFAPVSVPARSLGVAVRDRVAPKDLDDKRAVDDVKLENERLRVAVLNLEGQLDEMRKVNDERQRVGDLRPMCTPFKVVGNDPSINHDSLAIAAGSSDNVDLMMPVVSERCLVGRIARAGAAGATVQLVTDPKFQATIRFVRENRDGRWEDVPGVSPQIARGAGDGIMVIDMLPLAEVLGKNDRNPDVGIQVGDAIALHDPDWPSQLNKLIIGKISDIRVSSKVSLFAVVTVKPLKTLSDLREVMVMNKVNG